MTSPVARPCTPVSAIAVLSESRLVLPGVSIGDHSVVGAGSVVTKDVPSNSLAAGNPARVLRSIQTGAYGRITELRENMPNRLEPNNRKSLV